MGEPPLPVELEVELPPTRLPTAVVSPLSGLPAVHPGAVPSASRAATTATAPAPRRRRRAETEGVRRERVRDELRRGICMGARRHRLECSADRAPDFPPQPGPLWSRRASGAT